MDIKEQVAKIIKPLSCPIVDSGKACSKHQLADDCPTCKALQLIPLVRAATQQETIDAVNEYVESKISFERLAEVMNINYYELASMVHKYSGTFKEGE